MRKLMILCFIIFFSVLSMLSLMNYSSSVFEKIEMDKKRITIDKPENVTNEAFLAEVDKALEPINADIMYRYADLSEKKPSYNYYKTNHTTDFVNISSFHKSIMLERSECISTTTNEGYTSYRLNFPSVYQDITFYNWYEASTYDLSSCEYLVSNDNYEEVTAAITNLGYPVTAFQGVIIFEELPISMFASIPALMLVASMCFYALSSGKKNVLKKMEGYTTRSIIVDELKYNASAFLVSFLAIETITLAAGAFLFKWALFQYIIFSLNYILTCLLVIFAGFIVSSLLIYTQNSAEHIKGKVPKKGIYLISILSKCIFLVFIMFFMTIALNNILTSYNMYRSAKLFKEKVSGYVTIEPGSNAFSGDFDDNFLSFYNETIDNNNGILIEASNYEIDVASGKTLYEEYGQNSIIVNDNYLSFNPIYDTNGKTITPDSFSEDKFNILIPDTKIDEMDKYREYAQTSYSLDTNFIIYDADKTDIYSYSAEAAIGEYGRIDEPVILIADGNWLGDYYGANVSAWCSTGSYFIKTYTDDPYSELLSLLEKTGVVSAIQRILYVSSASEENLSMLLRMLRLYASQSIALLIGLASIVIFSTKLYCENYRDRIAYSLIEGYSLPGCIKSHLILIITSYITVLIIILFVMKKFTGVSMNLYILAGTFIGEIIITFILSKKYTRINLYEIVKGAE
ncbi:MAG: hypothetical protein U9O59_03395 [Actinomycetota bacterium]|nr:hypothetical protein [Actinomycetota bacterium]